MDTYDEVKAAQAIRTCKAKYWHYMDMKQWDKLRAVFAKDAVADFRGERDLQPRDMLDKLPPAEEALAKGDPAVHRGRDHIVDNLYAGLLQGWMTFHLGGEPIIEITSPTTATGMWPLFDYISFNGRTMKGYGHYFDEYVFEDGAWRISYTGLTRIRSDGDHPADFSF